MGTIKRKFHLPTINFQGYVSFGGNKWFFLYHCWLYSPSLLWLQKCWLLYPTKPAVKISPGSSHLSCPQRGGFGGAKEKRVEKIRGFIPKQSMYGIFTYIWLIFMGNVGKYTYHTWILRDWKKSPLSTGYMPRYRRIDPQGQAYFPLTCGRKLESFIFSEAPYDWYQWTGLKWCIHPPILKTFFSTGKDVCIVIAVSFSKESSELKRVGERSGVDFFGEDILIQGLRAIYLFLATMWLTFMDSMVHVFHVLFPKPFFEMFVVVFSWGLPSFLLTTSPLTWTTVDGSPLNWRSGSPLANVLFWSRTLGFNQNRRLFMVY